jgi:NNP family nitrate/nitrite transporter-like MFS transporter
VLFLTTAVGLGLGNGAVFKLVPQYFPRSTGLVTGIAGAAGGLGGFFPPLLMGLVRDNMGNYSLGFILLAVFAVICLIILLSIRRGQAAPILSAERT